MITTLGGLKAATDFVFAVPQPVSHPRESKAATRNATRILNSENLTSALTALNWQLFDLVFVRHSRRDCVQSAGCGFAHVDGRVVQQFLEARQTRQNADV